MEETNNIKIYAFKNLTQDSYIYVAASTYFEAYNLMMSFDKYADMHFDMHKFDIIYITSDNVFKVCKIDEEYRNMPFFIGPEAFDKLKQYIVSQEKDSFILTKNNILENTLIIPAEKVPNNLFTLSEYKESIQQLIEEQHIISAELDKYFDNHDYILKTLVDVKYSFPDDKDTIYKDTICMYTTCKRETDHFYSYINHKLEKYKNVNHKITDIEKNKIIISVDNNVKSNINEYKKMNRVGVTLNDLPMLRIINENKVDRISL